MLTHGLLFASWMRAALPGFPRPLRALMLVLCAAQHAAGQSGVIKASIVDSDDRASVYTTASLDGDGIKLISRGNGHIVFSSLAAGKYQLTVRAIGYAPQQLQIQLARNDTVSGTLTMVRLQATLDTMTVKGMPTAFSQRLEEFESRRVVGLGRFLDWRFFQQRRDRRLGSVLDGLIPGLAVRRIRHEETLVTKRNGSLCIPQGIVNGIIVDQLDLSLLSTEEVLGFEFYTPATTPPKYNRTGAGISGPQCGTVVLWTK